MIPALPAIQVTAMVATWLLFDLLEYRQAVLIIWAIGFSHYLLGLIYSRAQITNLISRSANVIPITLLLLGGTGLFFINGSLTYYFILHHAINETYIGAKFISQSFSSRTRNKLQSISFVLQLSGALILVATLPKQLGTSLFVVLFAGYISLLIYYLYFLHKQHPRSGSETLTMIFTELGLLFLIPLNHWMYDISLYHVVFYHFAFWIIFPANGQLSRGLHRQFVIYLFATVTSIWVFVSFVPMDKTDVISYVTRYQLYEFWFVVFSFVHITLSFSISNANPPSIINLFNSQNRLPAQKAHK